MSLDGDWVLNMAFRSAAQPFCSHTTPEVAAHYICIPLLLMLCFGFRYILYTWMGAGDADGGCSCPLGFTTWVVTNVVKT